MANLWKPAFYKSIQCANRVSLWQISHRMEMKAGYNLARNILAFLCYTTDTYPFRKFTACWVFPWHLRDSLGISKAKCLVHSRRLLFCIMVHCLIQSANSQKDDFLTHWFSQMKNFPNIIVIVFVSWFSIRVGTLGKVDFSFFPPQEMNLNGDITKFSSNKILCFY